MEAKHTPGPWHAYQYPDEGGEYAIRAQNGIGVALSIGGTKSEAANARLIAAAPELLEALQAVLRSFPTDGDMRAAGWEQTEIDLACRDYEAARAAVDKATQ